MQKALYYSKEGTIVVLQGFLFLCRKLCTIVKKVI